MGDSSHHLPDDFLNMFVYIEKMATEDIVMVFFHITIAILFSKTYLTSSSTVNTV